MVRSIRVAARRATAVAVVTAVLAVAGCSGDEDGDQEGAPPSPEATAPAPALRTDAKFGVVTGKLDQATRASLKQKVTAVVDDWLTAAYLGSDYPRSDFTDAFPHFTARAAKLAERDGLMSNAKLGDRIDTVEPTRSQLRIDVLAVRRQPVGVTARFALTMGLAGDINRSEKVSGRLLLTNDKGDWKVFGYDVQRGRA
jgi:hypothetical protein